MNPRKHGRLVLRLTLSSVVALLVVCPVSEGSAAVTPGHVTPGSYPLPQVSRAVAASDADSETSARTATPSLEGRICTLSKYGDNPVLSVGPGGSWDASWVYAPAVVEETGVYRMWYTGCDGSNPCRIGLATSTDAVEWTKDTHNPVLLPTAGWEAHGIKVSSVLTYSGYYEMWYTGWDDSGVGRIGYATSPDGVTWTKSGSNPVLGPGASGGWEDSDVADPTVIRKNSTYQMWYEGYDGATARLGYATSSNGVNWTKNAASPVLDIGSPGEWDWLHAYSPSVVAYGDAYVLWYSGGTLPPAWQTGYAHSLNGVDWTRGGRLISQGPPGAFDDESADYPAVIVDDYMFQVWYSGYDGDNYAIGYATAEMCGPGTRLDELVFLPLAMSDWVSATACSPDYADDFSDDGSGWPVHDNAYRRYAYTGGEYQILVKNASSGWTVTAGAKAIDFAAVVSARRTSGTYGAYGIEFGINEDWSQLYDVVIDDEYYSVWRYDGGWTALRDWTSSEHIATGTNWNRLKVVRDGASIAVYVNDHHLTTVTDAALTGLRRIGLTAWSPGTGSLDARFDDFALYPASCGASAASAGLEMVRSDAEAGLVRPRTSPRPWCAPGGTLVRPGLTGFGCGRRLPSPPYLGR